MPTQTSSGGTPFADVLDALVSRIVAGVGADVPVHIIARPSEQLTTYQGQEGVLVWVSAPQPVVNNGAGRYNTLVYRTVNAVVLTLSLSDPSFADPVAVRAHLTREEQVCNAAHLIGPVGSGTNVRTGVVCEWVPGGDDIARLIKTDVGTLKSGLSFRVQYVAPMTVVRD